MKRLLALAVLVLLCVSMSWAQLPVGTILGTVKDASGGVVPGARITATNTSTNVTRTTDSANDGLYRIDGLQPGTYNLTIEKQGFSTEKLNALTLTVAQNAEVNPTLKVGSVQETVQVEADTSPQINVTTSSLGGLVNDQQIVDLPLNGRNFIDLALLQPGVANATNNGPNLASTWFSSNGAPIRSNTVTLDGAPMMNVKGSTANAVGSTLGVDGIQEYRVLTNSFGAQYGINMGSQVVIVSKGGTNRFHGDVFDYLRNDDLDAWGYFAKTQPRLVRNNFGGSFGGPIRKDKTFFYGVYEGLRLQSATPTTINTLPANCHTATSNPCATAAFKYQGTSYAANSGQVNPAIFPFLQFYPLPNTTSASTYTYNPVTPTNVDYYQIRVDHTLSAADTLFGRFTMDRSYTLVPTNYAGTPYVGVGQGTRGNEQFDTLSETHIFSPSLLNTLRFSYSRTIQDTYAVIPPAFAQPGFNQVYNQTLGQFTISGGIAGIGPCAQCPAHWDQNIYTLSDDVNWTKGRHALQFGTLLNRLEYYTDNHLYIRGMTTFSSTPTFLAGTFTGSIALTPGSNTEREPRLYTLGFYAQDDWRVNSRLTVNLGLRYEPDTVAQDRLGNNWSFHNVTDPGPTHEVFLRNASFKNFGPRVGFAWDVRGNGKTSVRAAFGEYEDVNSYGYTFFGTSNGTPPLSSSVIYPAQTIGDLSATNVSNGFPLVTAAQALVPGTLPYGTAIHAMSWYVDQPHLLQWNFSISQQVAPSVAVSVSYVGTRGIHLWDNEEGNPCLPKTVTNGIPNWGTDTGTFAPFTLNGVTTSGVSHICNTVMANGQPLIATYPGTSTQYVVPTRLNPLWGDWIRLNTGADSYYHGLQVTLNKRISHGLESQVAYTFSKTLDDTQGLFNSTECTGSGGDPIQSLQPERRIYDRGPACFDIPQQVQVSVLYHLPTIHGGNFVGRELLNGWWLGNKSSWQAGYPFTPTVSNWRSMDQNITGNNNGAGTTDYVSYGTTTVAPGQTGADGTVNTTNVTFIPYNRKTAIVGTAQQWFNPLMFTMNPIGQLGTAHKNAALRGPHFANVDLSLNKDTAAPFLGEKGQLEFRAEAFNLFNHTNLGFPQGHTFAGSLNDVGIYTEAPTTSGGVVQPGRITTIVGNQRQLQLSLKLLF